ncbi:MAG: alpha/beta hydrolase [Acidobacteria bacterium]|nr:MAG: alpha/beta hydrolase [Acidobacteriota bacterium]REK10671.1 MAG: alpha/beta hydrolase [Acidobacteriota bacterium]
MGNDATSGKRSVSVFRRAWRIVRWPARALGVLLLLFVVWLLIPLRGSVDPIEPNERTAWWTLRDGHRIAYQKVGASSAAAQQRPAIVFLHGGPGGYVHSTAVEVIDRVGREIGVEAFLYDQIGSGLSDRLERPKDYSFERHVADLAEIVGEEIGRPVLLVGQSYGGVLASWFTAHHADLVAATVLASPGGLNPPLFDDEGRYLPEQLYPVPAHYEFRDAIDVREEMSPWSLPPRAIASMALAMVNVKLMPDREADGQLNRWATRFTKGLACDPANVPPEEGGGGFYAHIWSNWFGGLEDPRERMRRTEVPVLVVQGACDTVSYAAAYEYAALYPRGRYEFIADAGHDIWWDRPGRFVEVLAEFFSETVEGVGAGAAEEGGDAPGETGEPLERGGAALVRASGG